MNKRNIAFWGLFAALFCISAWLCLPFGNLVFSLQTGVLFLSLFLLGGKATCLVVFVYLLLGTVGLPVFSGFRGGIGMLLGPTGGFLFGFLACSLLYWLLHPKSQLQKIAAALLGLAACYSLGALWFWFGYAKEGGLWVILLQSVVPYVLPDLAKLFLGFLLAKRLSQVLPA